MKYDKMVIGVPKEILQAEKRVAAAPDTAAALIKEGASVLVEHNAGRGSFFEDEQYKAVGAEIVSDPKDLYARSDIILKVKEPQFNDQLQVHEVDLMHPGQYLICFLHPASPANHDLVKKLAAQNIISFTLDSIPRISRAQAMDALTSMSTVAGYKAVLMAACRLPKFMPMLGTAVGMIYPAEVLVVGAGVAGLQAAATAKRLGAKVTACDIRPDACEQAKSLGVSLLDLPIDPELALGEGGYARRLPPAELEKEREVLAAVLPKTDMVILSALVPGRKAPILITETMVGLMRPGSIIIDISIDQGGNCALAKPGETVEHQGIIIDGTKNIPGTLPTHATLMFAKNVVNFIDFLVQDGKVSLDRSDVIIRDTLVTCDGQVVHAGALETMEN